MQYGSQGITEQQGIGFQDIGENRQKDEITELECRGKPMCSPHIDPKRRNEPAKLHVRADKQFGQVYN